MTLTVLDLFSGIGGFSLGLEMTGGFKTVQFVEQDEKCQRVLRKHWPEVPIHGDIKTYDPSGTVDVVCGGFPCQPFSIAGKRRGAEDDRHLWPEMRRVIDRSRPAWVVGENVAGIIRMELDQVLSDLEAIGYTCRTYVIPACAVDAPHRRDRVWVVGYADRHSEPASAEYAQASELFSVVAYADSQRLEGRHRCNSQRHRQAEGRSVRPFAGAASRWAVEPRVGRVVNGVPGRVDRLRQLGNAVVPQVVAQIGRAILEAHHA